MENTGPQGKIKADLGRRSGRSVALRTGRRPCRQRRASGKFVNYIILTIPGLALILLGLRQKKGLGIACKPAAYLPTVSGGDVSLAELSRAMAVKESALIKALDRLIRKRLPRQTTLDRSCGALLFQERSREIHSYVCPYCGADVAAEEKKPPCRPYCGRSFEAPED